MRANGPFHIPATLWIGWWVESGAGVDTPPRLSSPLPSNYTDYYIPGLLDGHSLRIILTSILAIKHIGLPKEIAHNTLLQIHEDFCGF
jgi:hypothetical protein